MLDSIDYFIYDLHSGKLEDLEWGIKALMKEPLPGEKVVIVVSSVLSWAGNPHVMVEDKPEPELDADGNPIVKPDDMDGNMMEGNMGDIGMDMGGDIGNVDNISKKSDEIGEESEYEDDDMEIGMEMQMEDKPLDGDNQDVNQPIPEEPKIIGYQKDDDGNEILDDGGNPIPIFEKKKRRKKKKGPVIPEIKYKRIGHSEEEFEKRIPLESYRRYKEYEDYLLNLKFEGLTVYIVCAGIPYGGPETVFNYHFRSSWLQDPYALPYFNNGENLIPTIHIKDLCKIIVRYIIEKKPESRYIFACDLTENKTMKNIIQSISRGIGSGHTEPHEMQPPFKISTPENEISEMVEHKAESLPELTRDDVYLDPKLLEKRRVELIFTKDEFNWKEQLNIDIKLNPSKFIDEEFEWHCKEGIPRNIPKLLQEFAQARKLRPLRIILNCSDKDIRSKLALKISKFFNIPVINYERIIDMMSIDREELSEEELFMNEKYLFLKDRMDFLQNNPDFINEANELLYDSNEIMMECLKYLLNENACKNRGYVLEGMPVSIDEINKLYYKKEEIVPEEGDMMDEDMDDMDIDNMDNIDNMGIIDPMTDNRIDSMMGGSMMENSQMMEDEKSEYDDEGNKIIKEPKQPTLFEEPKLPPVKKKKIKPKKYKIVFEKNMLPESVITICFNQSKNAQAEVDNIFWEAEQFFQENGIEPLNLLFDENIEEIFELMRIFIERVS
jgi:hypothetical protein